MYLLVAFHLVGLGYLLFEIGEVNIEYIDQYFRIVVISPQILILCIIIMSAKISVEAAQHATGFLRMLGFQLVFLVSAFLATIGFTSGEVDARFTGYYAFDFPLIISLIDLPLAIFVYIAVRLFPPGPDWR
jgi:hypothetical protein